MKDLQFQNGKIAKFLLVGAIGVHKNAEIEVCLGEIVQTFIEDVFRWCIRWFGWRTPAGVT